MSQNQKPMVGARVPLEWKQQILGICQESGKSESEVVQEAIAAYLGRTNVASVQSMNKRVIALERKYQKLLALVGS
jgi:predicted DNA-binding protein